MSRYFIDVREPFEYDSDHVENAVNIPPFEMMGNSSKLQDIPKNAEIILYCRTGSRSDVAKSILESMGYTNVINGINKDHVEANYLAK